MSEVANILPTATPSEQKILKALSADTIYGSITELCQTAGVDRSVWYDALKKDYFVGHLSEGGKAVLWATFPAIVDKMAKQAKAGSFPQQKMILEMLKVYQGTPQVAVQNNLQVNNYNGSPDQEQEIDEYVIQRSNEMIREGKARIEDGILK